MEKIFTKEVKISIVAIIGVIALFFGMNFLKGLSLFSNSTSYVMMFSDAKGLTRSTAIYADGYKVGSVMDIIYDYDKPGNITIMADIDPALRIPAGSTAEIESDLMGNMKVILLLANNPRQKMEPGDTIQGVTNDGALGQLQAMVPTIEQMLPKLDSIMTSLNTIISDPAIIAMLHNAEVMSANLASTTAQLDAMMQGVNHTLPGLMNHVDKTMANTEVLTGNLAQVDIATTMSQVNKTLDNVEQLTRSLNSQQGTVGKFLHDPTLYNNMSSTMGHVDSLMIDLKAHPKRYVHFSIFGKKDK